MRLLRAILSWGAAALLAVGAILLWVFAALLAVAAGADFSGGDASQGTISAIFGLILCGLGVLAYRCARSPAAFPGIRLLAAILAWAVTALLGTVALAAFWPHCMTLRGLPPERVCTPDVVDGILFGTFALMFWGVGMLAFQRHRARWRRLHPPPRPDQRVLSGTSGS
jgi:hypothetical protein